MENESMNFENENIDCYDQIDREDDDDYSGDYNDDPDNEPVIEAATCMEKNENKSEYKEDTQ